MGIDFRQLSPAAQKQALEKLRKMGAEKAVDAPKRLGKYNNIADERITDGGVKIRFASKAEARRYDELCVLKTAGVISDLRLQHEFTLIEAYTTPDGKRVRAEKYIADFTYWRGGEFVVEDVKSKATKTKTYEIKKKQMLDKYGIEVQEIE